MSELIPLRQHVQLSLDDLAAEANREHQLCRGSAYAMVEHALAAGRALLAAKAQLDHGAWLPWLADNFDASRSTAYNYIAIASNSQRVGNLDAPGLTLRGVLKRLERVNRENATPPTYEPAYDYEIRHGDLRTTLDDLTGIVDGIVTDPPYGAQWLDEYDALGALAARLLRPGGILVAMSGSMFLPELLERLGRHLRYRWCGAYLMPGPAARIHARQLGSKWKPILIYGGDRFLTQDVFESTSSDKEHHEWGQSESGMADIVARLTLPGELIVDPFLGAGTTAVVCRDLGRRFIGCDVDPVAIAHAQARLNG